MIWTYSALEATTLPLCSQFHQLWQGQPITLPNQQQSPPGQYREETNPMDCRQFPVLCLSSGSYNIDGII
jgi:hypothetical protein